ncbi:beta-glucoside-specific PTS transporter subunit IIABC [Enterococcus sp. HY326]|uniref:beta-glucoside-specific PTS transporter subunit IIABC n=1 Tax=Enterococcus sp. HY326 TaxID=2971265 RepID=UPI00223EA5E0|nr:beta-glucoside-specific PTS transporter subunit IIABC [Enterococcus sp. HY326]
MSDQYKDLAKQIVDNVGGVDNIDSLHHCQTRLRFKLKDNDKANQEAIAALEDVPKVLINGGMFQVVIGMNVGEVNEEVEKYMKEKGFTGSGSVDNNPTEKKKPLDVVADFVSSIFSPIIPALAGAGMVKALLAILVTFNLVDTANQTYIIINMIGDATFAFLPILLAFTTAQKLKINPYLAAVVAGIMVHATWGTLVAAGEPVDLFGFLPLYLVRYTSSVIPVILVVLVQAPIEKFLNKIVPKALRLVFVPMILFLIMGVLALSIIGPAGDYIGTVFTFAFTWLSDNVSWAPAMVMGGLYSLLVIFGLHHGLAPLGFVSLAQLGYDAVFGPGVLVANVGQGTATLMVGLLSKNSKTKQIATSAGITGLMGITEPALYGVNVPKKYPLIAGCIGGALGGLFAGITGTRRFATGSSGLPAIVMYIGDDTMRFFYQILISVTITIVVTAVVTVVLFKKYEKDSVENADAQEPIMTNQEVSILSPVAGKIIPLSEVKDQVFSEGILGKGVAVEPTSNEIYAPVSGTVTTLFPTKHAIGITSEDGTEILIHIGLETVELKGDFFEAHVKQGDQVTQGQLLITADFDQIKQAGYIIQTPVVITNSQEYREVEFSQDKTITTDDILLSALPKLS